MLTLWALESRGPRHRVSFGSCVADLQAAVAGVVPRALAFTIDFFIRWVIFIIVLTISSVTGKAGIGLLLITFFILEWWYPVLFEVFRNGQTPGKKAFGIKVVKDDLTPISFGPSLTRNLLRTADFLPTFYVFGIISAVCTTKFQRLGDLAAGTLVIYSESLASPKENTLDKVEPIVPNRSSVTRMSLIACEPVLASV